MGETGGQRGRTSGVGRQSDERSHEGMQGITVSSVNEMRGEEGGALLEIEGLILLTPDLL